MSPEALKARLMSEAEKAIDELLAAQPVGQGITLGDIERLVIQSGQQYQAGLLQELGQRNGEIQAEASQACPQCGSRMQRRGQRKRQLLTEAGAMSLERTYAICPDCGEAFFPSRQALGAR